MRGRKRFFVHLAALFVPLATLVFCPLSAHAALPQTSSPADPRPQVTFKNGLLTLRGQDRPLRWFLDEISREAKVAMMVADGVGEERLSADFNKLPVEEALRDLLQEYDVFFFYSGQGAPAGTLRAVWVYPQGQGQGLEPVPPEKWASTKEVEERLADSDPEVRARSIETLIERKGDQALEAVLKALEDEEAQVRVQALYQALAGGLELPESTLANLLLSDDSSDVRFLALEALATGPEARWTAERALTDPSPQVQQKAREILRGLEAASRPAKPAPPAQGQRPPQE